MKLYIYEHCPFCTRARMIFGLKGLPIELRVIREDDAETPTRLIGKKVLPILTKSDGRHLGESLDIVRYVDSLGTPVLTAPPDTALDAWGKDVWKSALKLFIPRFTTGEFAELSPTSAREAYRLREQQAFGDLGALLEQTPELLEEVNQKLEVLAPLLLGRKAVGYSDITLWPILRSLTIAKGVNFPLPVRAYVERLEKQSGVPLLLNQAV